VRLRGLWTTLALLAGCDLFGEPAQPPGSCSRDSDCPAPQRCYVDGCGTLPSDLLAEVITSELTGVTSVDLALGSPRANLPIVLPDAQLLQLNVRRGAGAYPASVQILATGASTLLPGVNRTTQTAGASVSGVFQVGLSTGRFTVLVSPLDPTVPPGIQTGVGVDAGVTPLTIALLPPALVQTLSGVVLAGPGQPEPVPPQVQLLAPDGRPLSALATADPAGAFQLSAGMDALDGGAVLQVTPGPGPLAAVAGFPVPDATRFAQPFLVGDTAGPIGVSGTVLGPDGNPVEGASIFVQGTVVGGGSGNVGPVFTARDGSFSIETLPQGSNGSLLLWIIPPPGSIAGLVRTALDAPAGAPVNGTWNCPSRPLLRGSVLLPDGGTLAGAGIRADPVATIDPATPLPPAGASGQTGQPGSFALLLDPAIYQLEVQASVDLPVVRSYVRVDPAGTQLDPIAIPTGRSLTAVVLRDAGTPVPEALVRVYRNVVLDDGAPRALVLGEGVSDTTGVATILLPQQ